MQQFHDADAAAVAIETLQAVCTRLRMVDEAVGLPLPKTNPELLEAVTDRLLGLREIARDINEAFEAILKTTEDA